MKLDVQVGDHIVVPFHGVGEIIHISFSHTAIDMVATIQIKDGLIHKPIARLHDDGYRLLATPEEMRDALALLCLARKKIPGRGWQQQKTHLERVQRSSKLADLAECIRDLYAREGEERSYSKLQLYEQMLERFADEVALVLDIPRQGMRGTIESIIISRKLPKELT